MVLRGSGGGHGAVHVWMALGMEAGVEVVRCVLGMGWTPNSYPAICDNYEVMNRRL